MDPGFEPGRGTGKKDQGGGSTDVGGITGVGGCLFAGDNAGGQSAPIRRAVANDCAGPNELLNKHLLFMATGDLVDGTAASEAVSLAAIVKTSWTLVDSTPTLAFTLGMMGSSETSDKNHADVFRVGGRVDKYGPWRGAPLSVGCTAVPMGESLDAAVRDRAVSIGGCVAAGVQEPWVTDIQPHIQNEEWALDPFRQAFCGRGARFKKKQRA